MKPNVAMTISRLEYLVAPFGCKPLEDSRQVPMTAGDLRTLLTTIRELEAESKKRHKKRHKKPSYAERGKPTYYSPE